ncbi:MAG: isopeptide-forming domain-containing fimbrial protein [Acaryochloridaceae cyanobacterium RU_4_10]|nr:isopeptide-forming domain-containing fimbrial protein [Acaryochloridaceae cyanobacterium RU_4_10]
MSSKHNLTSLIKFKKFSSLNGCGIKDKAIQKNSNNPAFSLNFLVKQSISRAIQSLKSLHKPTILYTTLTTGLLLTSLSPVRAEGSKELTTSGGYRPFISWTNSGLFAGVLARTTIFVYAQAGETINLGSSAQNIGSGKINYTKPNGTTGSCALSNTVGRIANRTQELAGPFPLSGGYTPCTVNVGATETGIWQVDFVSPDPTAAPNVGFTPVFASANWTQTTTGAFVAAWDVTVTQGASVKSGRAYTKYLSANMGGNISNALSSALYVMTYDGYRYKVDANGIDPFAFIFFSNNKGAHNTTTDNPAYRSFDSVTLPTGFSYLSPTATDTSTSYTNKLFFNPVDILLPGTALVSGGSTWLNPNLAPPPPPTNISLIGAEGTANQTGKSLGGTFRFTNPDSVARPYQIILDLNRNNVFGDGNDRVLTGSAAPGNNAIVWDGKDLNGTVVPAQTSTFNSAVALLGGEVHFPLLDAESNLSGLIFQRLNGTFSGPVSSPIFSADYIYYNDSQIVGNGGAGGSNAVAPNPKNAINGISSSSGAHAWGNSSSNGFGNLTFIDTWAYAPQFSASTLSIVVKNADLQITKTLVGSAVQGQTVTYSIDVTNVNDTAINSVSDVVGAAVQDVLVPDFSNPNVLSCQVTSGTGNCGTYGFTGNTFNATVDLNSGSSLRFTIQAKLSASATGPISNSATVNRPKDVGDPVDQDSSGGTNLSETVTVNASVSAASSNSNLLLVKRITAINGVKLNVYKDNTDNSTLHAVDDNNVNWPAPLNTDAALGDTTISTFLRARSMGQSKTRGHH